MDQTIWRYCVKSTLVEGSSTHYRQYLLMIAHRGVTLSRRQIASGVFHRPLAVSRPILGLCGSG